MDEFMNASMSMSDIMQEIKKKSINFVYGIWRSVKERCPL